MGHRWSVLFYTARKGGPPTRGGRRANTSGEKKPQGPVKQEVKSEKSRGEGKGANFT